MRRNRFLFSAVFTCWCFVSPSAVNAAASGAPHTTQSTSLAGSDWHLAIDGANTGVKEAWFATPPFAGSKRTSVPGVIQDTFHNYHGYAWYWREFAASAKPHAEGRSLLRFQAVDYKAEVWVNGQYLGVHEGSETPFEMDATQALMPWGRNHLGTCDFGQGRFIVNTLHIAENLGKDPAADRLSCNLLNYAAKDTGKPVGRLPENFDRRLKEIGYLE